MPLAWLVLIVVPGILIWVFLGWQKLWLLLVWCGAWLLLFLLVDIWEEHRWFKFSESGEPSVRLLSDFVPAALAAPTTGRAAATTGFAVRFVASRSRRR